MESTCHELLNKLKTIRISGINGENKIEARVYFKCINNYLKNNFEKVSDIFSKYIDELIIYGYYLGIKSETFSLIDKLELLSDDYRKLYNHDQMLSNKKFYIPQLNIKKKYPIRPDCSDNFVPMNASIIKMQDKYLLLCRTVNYCLLYTSPSPRD